MPPQHGLTSGVSVRARDPNLRTLGGHSGARALNHYATGPAPKNAFTQTEEAVTLRKECVQEEESMRHFLDLSRSLAWNCNTSVVVKKTGSEAGQPGFQSSFHQLPAL